ncbi:MAG: IS1595 family transposase [Edaphobacter sp.]
MKNLLEAVRYFSDPQVCIDTVASMRWEDGEPECPKCMSKNILWLANQKRWKCRAKGCAKQFSVKVNTIFEDSPIGLDKWLVAMWLIGNCKNGISSYEVARDLGITQKSAWFMLHRIRVAMKDTDGVLLGVGEPIEVDETFIGGKPKNMHKSRRRQIGQKDHKIAVMGMLDRSTREVRAKVVPNVKRETLQNEIMKQVSPGETIYSDGWSGYDGLSARSFVHETVTHIDEYVRGQVHTQGIENFWSLLKRGLHGTYVAVEPFHLDAYIDEQIFRFNTRKTHSDESRLAKVLSQVAGKRLTYKELTGKVGETAF